MSGGINYEPDMRKIPVAVTILTACLAAACSEPEISAASTDAISLEPSTMRSRAAVQLLDADFEQTGFRTWGVRADEPTAWMADVDGTNRHRFADDAWGFSEPVTWPAEPAAYPLQFFATYPDIASVEENSATHTVKLTVAIPDDPAEQRDLLFARTKVIEKPADNRLSVTFEHALSKIDFTLTVGRNCQVHVIALQLKNAAAEGSAILTDDQTVWVPNLSRLGSYSYFSAATERTFESSSFVQPLYNGDHAAHLMVLPQTLPEQSWNLRGAPDQKAHVLLVYRLTADDQNKVGYAMAREHPAYATHHGTDLGPNEPLYVRAAWPISLSWEPGRSYTYNITLDATHGGYLADACYYQANGQKSPLLVGADADNAGSVMRLADPLLGNGVIRLQPEIDGWSAPNGGNLR